MYEAIEAAGRPADGFDRARGSIRVSTPHLQPLLLANIFGSAPSAAATAAAATPINHRRPVFVTVIAAIMCGQVGAVAGGPVEGWDGGESQRGGVGGDNVRRLTSYTAFQLAVLAIFARTGRQSGHALVLLVVLLLLLLLLLLLVLVLLVVAHGVVGPGLASSLPTRSRPDGAILRYDYIARPRTAFEHADPLNTRSGAAAHIAMLDVCSRTETATQPELVLDTSPTPSSNAGKKSTPAERVRATRRYGTKSSGHGKVRQESSKQGVQAMQPHAQPHHNRAGRSPFIRMIGCPCLSTTTTPTAPSSPVPREQGEDVKSPPQTEAKSPLGFKFNLLSQVVVARLVSGVWLSVKWPVGPSVDRFHRQLARSLTSWLASLLAGFSIAHWLIWLGGWQLAVG